MRKTMHARTRDYEIRDENGGDDIAQAIAAIGEIRSAVDAFRGTTEERFTGINALVERIDTLEARMNRPGTGAANDNAQAEIERRAFMSYLRYGAATPAEELRTLVVGVDPSGGYLAPAAIGTEFIRDLVEFSPIRTVATVRSITSPSIVYPRRTSVTNASWRGEVQDQSESTVGFGQVEIPTKELSTFVDVSNQLLADSAGTAESEIRLALAEDFGQKEGLAFVSGDGALAPQGLMTAAGVSYTPTGNASTLGTTPADTLITHFYSLKAAYRNRGTWLMNGATLAAIRKLKDGTTGVFLWQPSFQAGQPETLLGRPVIEVPDMDDVGTAAEPIIFGDFASAYRIVDRLEMSVLTNPYLLATKGITRIHATRRTGAGVVKAEAVSKIKCATS